MATVPFSRGGRVLALLGLGLTGCGQDEPPQLRTDLFAERCAELLACNCDAPQFADQEVCARVYAVQFAEFEGAAAALGLAVDPACFVDDLPVSKYHCATNSAVYAAPEPACSYCAPIHGEGTAGASCVGYDGFSDCARGLRCVAERCVDPCAPGDAEIPCETGRRCTPGFYCELDGDVCRPIPQQGDRCWPECGKGLVCEYWREPSVCGPTPGEGERCTAQTCTSDLVCIEGICSPRRQLGESCSGDLCVDNAECDFMTHLCTARGLPGEACEIGGRNCIPDAYCDYEVGRCERDSEAGEACGGFQECVVGLRCHGEPSVCGPYEAYLCEP